jgi:hypothetical protein
VPVHWDRTRHWWQYVWGTVSNLSRHHARMRDSSTLCRRLRVHNTQLSGKVQVVHDEGLSLCERLGNETRIDNGRTLHIDCQELLYVLVNRNIEH